MYWSRDPQRSETLGCDKLNFIEIFMLSFYSPRCVIIGQLPYKEAPHAEGDDNMLQGCGMSLEESSALVQLSTCCLRCALEQMVAAAQSVWRLRRRSRVSLKSRLPLREANASCRLLKHRFFAMLSH